MPRDNSANGKVLHMPNRVNSALSYAGERAFNHKPWQNGRRPSQAKPWKDKFAGWKDASVALPETVPKSAFLPGGREMRLLDRGKGCTQEDMFSIAPRLRAGERIMDANEFVDAVFSGALAKLANSGSYRTSLYCVYRSGIHAGNPHMGGRVVMTAMSQQKILFVVPDVPNPYEPSKKLLWAKGMLVFPISKLVFEGGAVRAAPDFNPKTDVWMVDIACDGQYHPVNSLGLPLRGEPIAETEWFSEYAEGRAARCILTSKTGFGPGDDGYHGSLVVEANSLGWYTIHAQHGWGYPLDVALISDRPQVRVPERK
jgi:hypothetical protein